jgi:hypothetical protein
VAPGQSVVFYQDLPTDAGTMRPVVVGGGLVR